MQNLRENSFKIERNLNWSESTRINLPTVMAECLFNLELPSLKETEMSKNRLFDHNQIQTFQSIFIFSWVLHLWFKHYQRHVVYNDITFDSVTCSLTLHHVTENRCVKCPVHFFRWNSFHSSRYEHFLTKWKQMKIQKIKLLYRSS